MIETLGWRSKLYYVSYHISQTPPIEILMEGLVRGPRIKVCIKLDEQKGRAVYADEDIVKGEYVLEYEVNARYKR